MHQQEPALAGPATWVRSALAAAHDLEEDLADPAQLAEITRQLAEIADAAGAVMVTGASALGHQLAGLVAATAQPPVSLWAQNGARGTVLVLEGVLVSGTQIAMTARRARAAGADRVIGAAVIAEPTGLEMCRRELRDDVRALRTLAVLG